MANADDGETTLSPDEAFSVLGNETRLAALRALGESDEPCSFSELHDAVDVDDSGQFNYHLDKLVGHFVRKTDDGYELRQPGRRVVEAVLSGAVTETPTFDRTPVDQRCEYCESPVEARWCEGSVELFCTSCDGKFEYNRSAQAEPGYLGRLTLPPAGLRGRDADEIVRTAWTWTQLEVMAFASGICPRCSATVEHDLSVCERHDASDGLCESCHRHHAVTTRVHCTNCIYRSGGAALLGTLTNVDVFDFLTDHGLNPVRPEDIHRVNQAHEDYEEAILSTDPLRVRFTINVDGDRLAVTVDEDLQVVETTRE